MIMIIILFIVSILFIFYLPGKFFLRTAKFHFNDFAITTASSFSIGICLFLLTAYLFAWLGFPIVGSFIMLILSIFEIAYIFSVKKRVEIKNAISFEMLIILTGSFAMAYLMWWSGMWSNNGLVLYSINATDSFYHLSLIGNLMHHFPPTHAGLDGVSLRGYHFFYDFLLANFSNIFGFTTLDLYFRLFPFFISFLYGISGFSLARFLNISSLSTKIFLFLLYFAESLGFFLTDYFHSEYSTGIIQSIAHILDPNVIFSVAILFTLFVLIFKSKNIFQIVLTAIVIGVLPNIKIYTAVIVLGALFMVSVADFFKNKNTQYFKIFSFASIIGSIVYLPINYGVGKLIFAPFLLYRHFMESAFIFYNFQWTLKYEVYAQHGNYVHIIILFIIALLLFFIPSLGFRVVSFFYLRRLIQKNFYTPPRIFWLISLSISFLIPTFFIQDTAVFVVIQFIWIGYILLLLPTSIVFGKLLNEKHASVIILFFGLSILLSSPDIFTAVKTFTQNPTYVSKEIVYMANFIQKKIPQKEKVLILNRDKKEEKYIDLYATPLISALSQHSVYYEPEVLEFKAVESIVDKRKNIIDKIQKITYTCDVASEANKKITTIMKNTKNQYILTFKNNSCFDKLHNFVKIHTEGELDLYKLL